MKLFLSCLTAVVFLLGCTEDTTGPSTIDRYQPRVNAGTSVFTFSGDTSYTLVFVDSTQRIASVHSMNESCGSSEPTQHIHLSAVSDSVDVGKLRTLFDSESHYIFILKLDDEAAGEISCRVLKQSELTYSGTGKIDYTYFGWGEAKERTGDSLYVAKSMSDEYQVWGVGTVKDINNGESFSYNSHCTLNLDLVNKEEEQLATNISLQRKY